MYHVSGFLSAVNQSALSFCALTCYWHREAIPAVRGQGQPKSERNTRWKGRHCCSVSGRSKTAACPQNSKNAPEPAAAIMKKRAA